jgi:hypothetical protein
MTGGVRAPFLRTLVGPVRGFTMVPYKINTLHTQRTHIHSRVSAYNTPIHADRTLSLPHTLFHPSRLPPLLKYSRSLSQLCLSFVCSRVSCVCVCVSLSLSHSLYTYIYIHISPSLSPSLSPFSHLKGDIVNKLFHCQ